MAVVALCLAYLLPTHALGEADAEVAGGPQGLAGGTATLTFENGSPGASGDADVIDLRQTDHIVTGEDGPYRASVSYDGTAGLPEDVTLEVRALSEDSEEYRHARETLLEGRRSQDESHSDDELGMAALDLTLRDRDGNEVEPRGAVRVRLEASDLPSEAAGQPLDVSHVTESDGELTAEVVQNDLRATDGAATAEFAVEGFSVFTITWTRDSSSAQRVGAVRLHTVDQAGNEIADPDSYSASELSRISGESGILPLADWVKTKDPTGYSYREARLGSASGTVVTGLKVAEVRTSIGGTTTSTYTLQYTSDATVGSSSSWADVGDALSGAALNGADVYLVFQATQGPHVLTIHYVDEDGDSIAPDTVRELTDTTTVTPAEEAEVAGYTRSGTGRFGMTTTDGRATGGTSFASMTFTKGDDGWSNTYATSPGNVAGGGTAADLTYDIWLVYAKMADRAPLVVHYVDEEGNALADDTSSAGRFTINSGTFRNAWNGYTFSTQAFVSNAVPSGYTFKADYLGGTFDARHQIPTGYAVQYRYSTSTGAWTTGIGRGARDTSSTHVEFDGYITDVYRVFARDTTYTVHYVDDHKNPIPGQATTTFTLDGSEGRTERDLDTGALVREIEGRVFVGSYLGSETGSLTRNASYVTTDYPHVSKVRLGPDGSPLFLTALDESPFTLEMTRTNRWAYTTENGRTFTLRRESTGSGANQSVRYSLVDDQVSASAVDLSLRSTGGTRETYVGSVSSEKSSMVYTLTATDDTDAAGRINTTYTLAVSEWNRNNQRDIYQVYGDPSSLQDPRIEVRNDLVFSGHLVVGMDPALRQALEDAGKEGTAGANLSDVSYTWYKIVDDTSEDARGTEVERTQTSGSSNIAQAASERTWLDLAADGGGLNASQASVRYYCVLTYTETTNGIAVPHTVTSNKLSVINYDELWNGSFENPVMTTNQVSNSWYYERNNGVWRTTGLGRGGMANHDIEIVNTTWGGNWWNAYNFASASDFKAKDGNQFAELNCEAAGALYQDVVTHPYESLNYWLSHRARGSRGNDVPEYDTMYLVIMPTKLAMTGGAGGGELKEQGELQAFIQSHGGFATSVATGEEATVTYRDDASGILVERISSNDQAWHTVSVASGYTAMAGLTRFFFVAGPTASGSNTVGNFLDDVGFSQQLPDPEDDQFQLVVTKTFSNLEMADIAKLSSFEGAEDPFTLTIRGYASATGASQGQSEDASAALDGARLTFTASENNTFTLHATGSDGSDLFGRGEGSNGSVTVNDDAGTVTMRWALLANRVEGTRYYTIGETGQELDGFTTRSTQTGSVEGGGGSYDDSTHVATVTGGDVVRMDFSNSYNQNSQITVQKVFSGITPTTLGELGSGYTVTLTRRGADGSADETINLVNDEQHPYVGDSLPSGIQGVSLSVRQGTGGTSVLLWTITGWDAGTYTVHESGYHPAGEVSRYNTLAGITVNGARVSEVADGRGPSQPVEVQIGGTSDQVPSVVANPSDGGVRDVPQDGTTVLTDADTNLLVAQHRNGDSVGYLVWTPEAIGANVRQAIINYIRTAFGLSEDVPLGQVTFYSAENPGTMQVLDAIVTYDSDTRSLDFDSSANTVWQSYYSTSYTLVRTRVAGEEQVTEAVANDEAEVRIHNNYNPVLKVRKIEEGHADRPLEGTTFRLYRLTDAGAREYYQDASTISSYSFGDEGGARSLTTDEAGTVTVGVLPRGIFYLEETVAPGGYDTVPDVEFAVSDDGVVALVDENGRPGSRTDHAEVTLTDPYYTITISDSLGAELPVTGGSGGLAMSPVYLAGLVAVALTCGWITLKRGTRRAG